MEQIVAFRSRKEGVLSLSLSLSNLRSVSEVLHGTVYRCPITEIFVELKPVDEQFFFVLRKEDCWGIVHCTMNNRNIHCF